MLRLGEVLLSFISNFFIFFKRFFNNLLFLKVFSPQFRDYFKGPKLLLLIKKEDSFFEAFLFSFFICSLEGDFLVLTFERWGDFLPRFFVV